MPLKLLSPEAVKEAAAKKFVAMRSAWLAGEGAWPLTIPLGGLTQKDLAAQPAFVGDWIHRWRNWSAPGARVIWEQRSWPALGAHEVPARVEFDTPEAVAEATDAGEFWSLTKRRRDHLVALWPQLARHTVFRTHLEVIAAWAEDDFDRLVAFLHWVMANPGSGLYLRQLPIPGLDTKWAGERRGAILDFLRAIREDDARESDFYAACGLMRPPARVRLRILCPELARQCGGLRDIEAPLRQVNALQLAPEEVFIVENLETGLALPEMPSRVVFMKLGLAVGLLAEVTWLQGRPITYWGDIDTHGFAILNTARKTLGKVRSALMDRRTVEEFKELAGREPKQAPRGDSACLTDDERSVLEGLYGDRWGVQLRLEQERLPLDYCASELFGRPPH